MSRWIEETLYADVCLKLKAGRVLHECRSHDHEVVVIENPAFGRVLYLDGVLQTTERDEFVYHEMLAHVPIVAHGRARRVLIIGGGDGGMLEEVLKHRTVERATLVEIDPTVVEIAKEHLRPICGNAFEDPRTELVFADGLEFVRVSEARFDVVIVDATDPIGPGVALFSEDFYRGCRRVLAPGGVLVTQNGVPFLQGGELAQTARALRTLFADVGCYLAAVPTYIGGAMAFGWASDDGSLRRQAPAVIAARMAGAGVGVRYYTPEVHIAAFALPGYVARLME